MQNFDVKFKCCEIINLILFDYVSQRRFAKYTYKEHLMLNEMLDDEMKIEKQRELSLILL